MFKTTPDDLDMHMIYDVSHNIAKVEEHWMDGKQKTLLVHRKGSTRAFPPHHPLIPVDYQVSKTRYWLRVGKEWICSERPFTICAIAKGWTCQGSLIWHQREVTRTNQGSRIMYIKEKPVHQHVQSTTFGLLVEASLFRLTGWFHIHMVIFI